MEKSLPSSSFSIFVLLLLLLPFLTHHVKPINGFPLSTDCRWIVDDHTKQRVKLACVNWVSHLDTVVAEGLSKQPLDMISKQIVSMGFNCVRLTYPTFLATDDSLASLTVRQSFQNLNLTTFIAGIEKNNPFFLDLSLIQAYQAVVSNLGDNNIMVILDNHLTKPGWCCSNNDDNGFFGDKYFNPDLWIQGLTRMATLFKGVSNVVGMSLRNELRGPKQNVGEWYNYMPKGAEAVHSANPNVLVILSGLSFDTDLSFLKTRQVNLSFTRKLVFEMHWYSFTDGGVWGTGNPNQVCGKVSQRVMDAGGFLLQQKYPLFLSEFGLDQRGTNLNDNRYLNCLMGLATELDLDWAYWTLLENYYLREGVIDAKESYGILHWKRCEIRNSTMLQKILALRHPFQGPGQESGLHKVIFHPATGLCVQKQTLNETLPLGDCSKSEAWSYTTEKSLVLNGTSFCVQADELGKSPKLGVNCGDSNSKWEMISDSKMHLSSKLNNADGTLVCLDVDSSSRVVINPCKCLSEDHTCDPASQWFKLVDSTRSPST
ncbi:hypothetical protein SLE2022_313540 [Rubroshorea leprosula]